MNRPLFALLAAGSLFASGLAGADEPKAPNAAARKAAVAARIAARTQTLEKSFAAAGNDDERAKIGAQLRFLYMRTAQPRKAADLSAKLYAAKPTVENAVSWGAMLLNCGENARACEVLARHNDPKNLSLTLYQALAAARTGDAAAARAKLAAFKPDELRRQGEKLVYARGAAALGDVKLAATAVSSIMRSAQPRHRNFWNGYFAKNEDFARVRQTPEFATALATVSEVPDAPLKKCASCPNRAKCAAKKAAAAEQAEKSSCATCPNRAKCAAKKAAGGGCCGKCSHDAPAR